MAISGLLMIYTPNSSQGIPFKLIKVLFQTIKSAELPILRTFSFQFLVCGPFLIAFGFSVWHP